MMTPPNYVNGGINQQLENAGSDDAADHRGGDALHDIGSGLIGGRPHDRQQTEKNRCDGHDFRSNPLHCAFDNSCLQISHGCHATFLPELIPSVIEVEQHDDACFSIESRQGNDADPYGGTEVVAQNVEQPECPYEREWDGGQNDGGLDGRAGVEINQHKNKQQGERGDEQEALESALLVFKRPSPLDVVSCGKL